MVRGVPAEIQRTPVHRPDGARSTCGSTTAGARVGDGMGVAAAVGRGKGVATTPPGVTEAVPSGPLPRLGAGREDGGAAPMTAGDPLVPHAATTSAMARTATRRTQPHSCL